MKEPSFTFLNPHQLAGYVHHFNIEALFQLIVGATNTFTELDFTNAKLADAVRGYITREGGVLPTHTIEFTHHVSYGQPAYTHSHHAAGPSIDFAATLSFYGIRLPSVDLLFYRDPTKTYRHIDFGFQGIARDPHNDKAPEFLMPHELGAYHEELKRITIEAIRENLSLIEAKAIAEPLIHGNTAKDKPRL